MPYTKRFGNFVCVVAVSFFFFLLPPLFSFAQEETDAVFILRGNTRLQSGKGVEGVDLDLQKGGKSIQKILSGKNGKYSMKIPISILNKSSEYTLFITQAGMVPKSIKINTYISPDEYMAKTFPTYYFDLEIKMNETKEKDIIINKPSARIFWDNEQHGFGFDQTFLLVKEDETEKLLAEKKRREEEEAAKKRAAEEARVKAEARFDSIEAANTIKKNLAAMRAEMKRKRMRDSLDSIATANRATIDIKKLTKPVSADDVDENAFDGTNAYSINIAKRSLKAQQEKMNKEKAANLSAKYETNNTLTSLLNMVDEHEKNQKSKAKSLHQ